MLKESLIFQTGASPSVSPENVKHAAMFGLSAAAMKSKLFADQEELDHLLLQDWRWN